MSVFSQNQIITINQIVIRVIRVMQLIPKNVFTFKIIHISSQFAQNINYDWLKIKKKNVLKILLQHGRNKKVKF